MMKHKPLSITAEYEATLVAILDGAVRLQYAKNWLIEHSVSLVCIKRSFFQNRGNEQIVDAMLGHQDTKNPAFVAIVVG